MNLYELIQYIPHFITETLTKSGGNQDDFAKRNGTSGPTMLGKFHLGL